MLNLLQEEINQKEEMQINNKQNEIVKNKENVQIEKDPLLTKQDNFLNSTVGKVINTGIDLGLRWILPDFVENQIIEVKNSLIKGGLKEGIDKAIENAIELGKSVTGIFTGKFDSISQAQNVIKNGGIIDSISNVIDKALEFTSKKGLIPQNITSLISQGKNVILDNVSTNIETEFVEQVDNIEKLGKYENNWRNYFKEKDFEGMEREYEKIRQRLKEIMPLEITIKQARAIENIHKLVKNNGHNFNLSEEQLQLAGVLV